MELDKLLESQENWVQSCEESLERCRKAKEDLVSVHERLSTLADVLSHDVMIPLCSVAFVPGQLERTNEIFAFIGDGYFVKRSSKQACEMVLRRMKKFDQQIEGFEKDLKRRRDWQEKTAEMRKENEGVVQIQEFMTEEEYQNSQEERRKKLSEARQALKLLKEKEAKALVTEKDLFERLDELELQEEAEDYLLQNDELVETESDESSIGDSVDENEDIEVPEVREKIDVDSVEPFAELSSVPKSVSFSTEGDTARVDEEAEKLIDSPAPSRSPSVRKSVSWNSDLEAVKIISKGPEKVEGSVVTFCASPCRVPRSSSENSSPERTKASSAISSPGDIYKMFEKSPRSILKETSQETPTKIKPILKKDERGALVKKEISEMADEILTDRIPANTGVKDRVTERETAQISRPSAQESGHRPLSKFKQARMKR